MKYASLLLMASVIGCKVSEPTKTVRSKTEHRTVVFQIDTLDKGKCLYSTHQMDSFTVMGEGSIITRCGCFNVNEEINYECIIPSP